jgi:hypothetical protein
MKTLFAFTAACALLAAAPSLAQTFDPNLPADNGKPVVMLKVVPVSGALKATDLPECRTFQFTGAITPLCASTIVYVVINHEAPARFAERFSQWPVVSATEAPYYGGPFMTAYDQDKLPIAPYVSTQGWDENGFISDRGDAHVVDYHEHQKREGGIGSDYVASPPAAQPAVADNVPTPRANPLKANAKQQLKRQHANPSIN